MGVQSGEWHWSHLAKHCHQNGGDLVRGGRRRSVAPPLSVTDVTRTWCRGGLLGLQIREKRDPEAQSQVALLWRRPPAYRKRTSFEPLHRSVMYFPGFSSSSD